MAKPVDPPGEKNCPECESSRQSLTPPYPIYCPSCGKLNYLNARKDFRWGRCTLCGSFFDLARGANLLARRVVAYPIFIALLTALFWLFFFSQNPRVKAPQSSPSLPAPQNPVAPKAKKFPIPPEPQPVQKFPLPQQSNPSEQSPQSTPPSVPQTGATPSPNVFQPQSQLLPGYGGKQPSQKVFPQHSQGQPKAENRNPYRRAWREKALPHQKKDENILEIPLPGSTGD